MNFCEPVQFCAIAAQRQRGDLCFASRPSFVRFVCLSARQPERNPMANEEKQRNDMNKVLFMNLVMMLASSAMQQMGKIVNPMTNKSEVNLEGAQVTIDMLTMIQARTRGNLDADEEKMLKDILSSLQLNYVEMAETAAKNETKEPQAGVPKAESAQPTEPSPASPDAGTKKDPKFRKSYGA